MGKKTVILFQYGSEVLHTDQVFKNPLGPKNPDKLGSLGDGIVDDGPEDQGARQLSRGQDQHGEESDAKEPPGVPHIADCPPHICIIIYFF